jgi:hypothetical protein
MELSIKADGNPAMMPNARQDVSAPVPLCYSNAEQTRQNPDAQRLKRNKAID